MAVFEPDEINFYCLNLNIKEDNVSKTHGVLGNELKRVSLSTHCDDCGAWRVANGDRYQMYRIDDLKLSELDLIHLDVEGFEIEVLKGGIESINKYHPIIAAEINHCNCSDFLSKIGYSKIDEVNGDWVFKYKDE